MKTLVLFGLALTVINKSFARNLPEDNYIFLESTAGHDCLAEHQLTKESVGSAFQKDYKITEGNKQINDYLACIWKKKGYLNDDGTINRESISAYVNFQSLRYHHLEDLDKILEDILKDCSHDVHKDDSAVKMYNCITKHTYGDRDDEDLEENPFLVFVDEKCSKGLDEAVIKPLHTKLHLPEGNDQINKYMDCAAKMYRYFTEDGKYNPDQIRPLVEHVLRLSRKIHNPGQVVLEILNGCDAVQGSDAGETAVKTNNCIIDFISSHNGTRDFSNPPLIDPCLKEVGLDEDHRPPPLISYIKHTEKKEEINLYYVCLWKDFLDEHGKVVAEKIEPWVKDFLLESLDVDKSKTSNDFVDGVITKCANIKINDVKLVPVETYKCFVENLGITV